MKAPQLIVSNKGGADIELVPPGIYTAICVAIYGYGTHVDKTFGKARKKLILSMEIPELPKIKVSVDGKDQELPRVLSQRFTNSLHEKSQLCQILEGWRGRQFTEEEARGFDLSKVLGKPATVQVMHEKNGEKTYANMKVFLPYKGAKVVPFTTPRMFDVSQLEHANELADANLPEWIAKLVQESEEYKELVRKPLGKETPVVAAKKEFPDDLPGEKTEEEDSCPF